MSHAKLSVPSSPIPDNIFISSEKAARIDQLLMSPQYGHSLTQLMELAGLAVAHAIADFQAPCRVSLVCGPGNNGGDGLVAARHLWHFGFMPSVVYPKRPAREPFMGLVKQLEILDIPFCTNIPVETDLIVDAMFGFSFDGKSGVREPFQMLIDETNAHKAPVFSVDVPSGWDVDRGDVWSCAVKKPAGLISLTMPKLCAKGFKGVHYVGGRFVPPLLCKELVFEPPQYEGINGITRIS